MLIIITIKKFRSVLGGSCLEIIISEQIGLLTKTSDQIGRKGTGRSLSQTAQGSRVKNQQEHPIDQILASKE